MFESSTDKISGNPVILHHLFQQCSPSVLAICRRVNKLWYDESLLIWRTAPITINAATPLTEYLELRDKPENQLSKKPYRNIKFSEFEFDLNSENFGLFWDSMGSNLHILTLYQCSFKNVEDFCRIIFKSCPILQKLTIDLKYHFKTFRDPIVAGRKVENDLEYKEPLYGEHKHLKSLNIVRKKYSSRMLPLSWTELFSHFPLMTTFKISYITEANFEIMIDAIKIIRKKDKTKLPFKRFQFSPNLTISSDSASHRKCYLVKKLHLPLTDCCIQVGPELDERVLKSTLLHLAPSVNTIVLQRESKWDNAGNRVSIPVWFKQFPFGIQLSKLTRLEANDVVENLSFLKGTPNLESFVGCQYYWLDDGCFLKNMIPNSCKEELANVQLLRLATLGFQFPLSFNEIQYLFNLMPNITNLHNLGLSEHQFGMVCQNWKRLRHLDLDGSSLTIEGITDLKKVKKAKKNRNVLIVPKIAKLKGLEVLKFRRISSFYFTSEVVCHLFLHLPSLQRLTVSTPGIPDCSVERTDVDVATYQQAIEDNLLEQWIADHQTRTFGTFRPYDFEQQTAEYRMLPEVIDLAESD